MEPADIVILSEVGYWVTIAFVLAVGTAIFMDYRRNLHIPVWEIHKEYKPEYRRRSILPSDESLCKVKAWSSQEALQIFYDSRFAGCETVAIDSAASLGYTYKARRVK